MPDPGHGLSGGELGRPPPGLQLARRVRIRASIRGPRLSFLWARPPWRSAAHRTVFLATIARSQCTRNARGRARRMRRDASAPVDCAASQASSVSRGGAPAAPCIASPRATANASFPSVSSIEVKCNRSCPNGKVQLLHLVKVARVVSGEKNQSGKVAPRAKGRHPLRLRQCESDLVLTGLTRLLQIGTDFLDGRAIFIHCYY